MREKVDGSQWSYEHSGSQVLLRVRMNTFTLVVVVLPVGYTRAKEPALKKNLGAQKRGENVLCEKSVANDVKHHPQHQMVGGDDPKTPQTRGKQKNRKKKVRTTRNGTVASIKGGSNARVGCREVWGTRGACGTQEGDKLKKASARGSAKPKKNFTLAVGGV